MMLLYRRLTGGADLAGFWRTTPAELCAWAEAISGAAIMEASEGMEDGAELED